MDKSVSIIIPVGGNHAQYVREAVASCMKANPQPYEVVVIDDAAEPRVDESALLDGHSIPAHLKFIGFNKQVGRSRARNVGAENANGSWLFFLDADDLLEPKSMADFCYVLSDCPDADLVYADYDYLDENDNRVRVKKVPWMRMNRPRFPGTANAVNIGMFVKRDRFLAIGGFDVEMSMVEYWDMFLRYVSDRSVVVVKHNRPFFVARKLSTSGEDAQRLIEIGTMKVQSMIRGGYYTRLKTRTSDANR